MGAEQQTELNNLEKRDNYENLVCEKKHCVEWIKLEKGGACQQTVQQKVREWIKLEKGRQKGFRILGPRNNQNTHCWSIVILDLIFKNWNRKKQQQQTLNWGKLTPHSQLVAEANAKEVVIVVVGVVVVVETLAATCWHPWIFYLDHVLF